MSLTLYFHPLSSFCHKVLIALYENDTPFVPHIVNLGDDASRAAFLKIWPIGKFPVLADIGRNCVVPESSIIIEYLDQFYPGPMRFVPLDGEAAWRCRLQDRFYDLAVQVPMQKIVTDRLRPGDARDTFGVAEARARLVTALDMVNHDMADRNWATGADFGLADCAAAPALFFANLVHPLSIAHPHAARYLDRLLQRPSFARAMREAEPFLQYFPRED